MYSFKIPFKPLAFLGLAILVLIGISGFHPEPDSADKEAAAVTYYKLQNRWKSTYIHTENGYPQDGSIKDGWWSAQWQLEAVAGGYVRIKCRHKGFYLHNENGKLQAGSIQSGWWSAQWKLESVGGGYFRIKNRWKGTYLHNEKGRLSLGAIQPGWWSAQWRKVPLATTTLPNHEDGPKYARATKAGKIGCGRGTFFDPIDGGTCWTCPEGYKRTVYGVKTGKACERAGGEQFAQATRHGRGFGPLGTNCADGQFWDPNGYCYSCPSGYKRTAYAVTSSKACSRRVANSFKPATLARNAKECPTGAFYDVGTNKCWKCPTGYARTVFPVTGEKACERR